MEKSGVKIRAQVVTAKKKRKAIIVNQLREREAGRGYLLTFKSLHTHIVSSKLFFISSLMPHRDGLFRSSYS